MARKITKLSGVSFNNPLLPNIGLTDDDINVGTLPGLIAWLKPEAAYYTAETGVLLDKATGAINIMAGDVSIIGSGINGQPSFQFGGVNGVIKCPAIMPAGDYTIVLVATPDAVAALMRLVCSADTTNQHFLGLTTSPALVAGHNSSTYITLLASYFGAKHKFMLTYKASTQTMKLYIDDVLTATATSVPAITNTTLWVGLSNTTGPFKGLMGGMWLFNQDYSATDAATAAASATLEAYLAAKYAA